MSPGTGVTNRFLMTPTIFRQSCDKSVSLKCTVYPRHLTQFTLIHLKLPMRQGRIIKNEAHGRIAIITT